MADMHGVLAPGAAGLRDGPAAVVPLPAQAPTQALSLAARRRAYVAALQRDLNEALLRLGHRELLVIDGRRGARTDAALAIVCGALGIEAAYRVATLRAISGALVANPRARESERPEPRKPRKPPERRPRERAATPGAATAEALGRRIDANGGSFGELIVKAAREAGLPLSLACALCEQESGFRNVFGHDVVRNPVKGGPVTPERYREYLRHVRAGLGRNGVGVTQLTWWEFQERADRLGGCWKVEPQLKVGFEVLADHIRRSGKVDGIRRYNGDVRLPQTARYAQQVLAREKRWAAILDAAGAAQDAEARRPKTPRTLRIGDEGRDVALLQRTLNRHLAQWQSPERLDVDGILGPRTELAFRRARLVLGLALRRDAEGRVLISPHARKVLRDPRRRTPREVARAESKGARFERRLRKALRVQRLKAGDRPKVIRLELDFRPMNRNTAIDTTVVHHSAGPIDHSDADAVRLCRQYHHEHKHGRGWSGIGYHACITRAGTLILLRPGTMVGAGVEHHNTGKYHVMFHGNYERDEPNAAQLATYRWLLERGHEISGVPRQGAQQRGHKDFPGHTTNACPGRNLHPHVRGN